MTVTAKTLGENIAGHEVKDYNVIYPIDKPFTEKGGLAVLFGNLAPDGAIIKTGGVQDGITRHEDLPSYLNPKKKPLKVSLIEK